MKYHYDGLYNLKFIKSLNFWNYYKIYIHWWITQNSLNVELKSCFGLLELNEFTNEMACHHYCRFKEQITFSIGTGPP